MRFFRELNPAISHLAVAAFAILAWVFVIVPLWRRWRTRLSLLREDQSLKRRLVTAIVVFLVFAAGLWTGWHKDALSARVARWRSDWTRTIPSPSPSPGLLTLPESSMDATVQTPASSPPIIGQSVASQPSLVTQLLREGIELRDIRGDTKTAIERFQEALDSEPNNPAVIAELAKTYDLLQLHDRATEIRRKSHETASSPGAADELADQQLKLGAAFPTAAPIPTLPAAPMPGLRPAASRPPASIREAFRAGSDADVAALDSSAREVRASPYETPSEFAKYAITPREREIDQLPPQPTATASEMSSPVTSASPAQLGPSAETALSQPGGHLIVLRAANFGWNVALNVKIDGKTAGNIVQGSRYDQFVPAGRHVLTVSAVPNYQPTSKVLDVQDGQTYVFTATRQNPDSVVLVPSALSRGQPH